jgi:hypothetical protein
MRTKTCCFALVLLMVMSAPSCSKSGQVDEEKCINQVQAALGQARSWHVSSNFALFKELSHLEEDVGCPFNYHRVGRMIDGVRRMPDEILATQNRVYSREDDSGARCTPLETTTAKKGPRQAFIPRRDPWS